MRKAFLPILHGLLILGIAVIAIAQPQELTTRVREGSDPFITIKFLDQNGQPVLPNSIKSIQVINESDGSVIMPAITPRPTVSTQTFQLTKCASKIVNNSRDSENKIITTIFTYGGSQTPVPYPTPVSDGPLTGTDYARYVVDNIPGIRVVTGTPPDCVVEVIPTPTPTS